jgi:hypothetical protein
MRARSGELAPQVVENFWTDPDRFFNRGTTGQWREFFGGDDIARYEARASQLASPDLLAWLHQN